MDKEKQIEEMIEAMSESCGSCFGSGEAECIYNAGYRKASDVAREIFEEIEKSIADLEYSANTPRKTVKVEELKAQCDWILHEVIPKTLAKLKKKYTESEKDK